MTEEWTPYGLEHIRAQAIRKRRFWVIGLVLGFILVWSSITDSSTTTETEILSQTGGNTIEFDVPEDEEKSGPDAVVKISPGAIVRAPDGVGEQAAPAQREPPPPFEAEPINWLLLLLRFGPILVVLGVLWYGMKGRAGKTDEVNFGVYKGAMPLEMITASHAHLVVTSRAARSSLFGRRREHYVNEPGKP